MQYLWHSDNNSNNNSVGIFTPLQDEVVEKTQFYTEEGQSGMG
jgi:hypothetical protein